MMISGLNSYSSLTYVNYNTSTEGNTDMAKGPQGPGGPQGGRPPGPGPKGGPKGGPNLDTDSDGKWSKSEIEEYASYSSEKLGISLDADEIMNKYDTDADGKINSDERHALGKDNGLRLPPPEELMKGMMSRPRPNSNDDENENNYFNVAVNTSYITMSVNAYTQSMNYNNESITAFFETTA